MTAIGKPLHVPNNADLQNLQGNKGVQAETVGKGALSGAGIVPPTPEGTGDKPDLTNALKSLTAFMTGKSSIDVEVLLVQVAVAMRDTEATTQKTKINTDQETKKAQMREKEHKLEESAKKLEKQQNGSIWEKIKLAFEWLGAMLAVALAVIASVASLGGASALIVAAVAAVALVINSTVTQATGQGIMGNIVLAAGGSKEEAAKADMGFQIAVAVIGIAGAVTGSGLGKAVKDIASTIIDSAVATLGKVIPSLAKTGADAAAKGADALAKTAGSADDALNAGSDGGGEADQYGRDRECRADRHLRRDRYRRENRRGRPSRRGETARGKGQGERSHHAGTGRHDRPGAVTPHGLQRAFQCHSGRDHVRDERSREHAQPRAFRRLTPPAFQSTSTVRRTS
jgi:hypothetical protein